MKTLLIIFLLLSATCYSQNSSELQDTSRKYCFTAQEITEFANWKIELNHIKTENKRLIEKDSLNNLMINNYKIMVLSKQSIIDLQSQQITKLLQEPKQVNVINSWKWYEIGGLSLTCVAIGVLTGLLIK